MEVGRMERSTYQWSCGRTLQSPPRRLALALSAGVVRLRRRREEKTSHGRGKRRWMRSSFFFYLFFVLGKGAA